MSSPNLIKSILKSNNVNVIKSNFDEDYIFPRHQLPKVLKGLNQYCFLIYSLAGNSNLTLSRKVISESTPVS